MWRMRSCREENRNSNVFFGSKADISARDNSCYLSCVDTELNQLEKTVIKSLAQSDESILSQHIPYIRALEREMTGVGFFTKLKSSLGPLSNTDRKIGGVSAESPDRKSWLSFILWLDADGTGTLEGHTTSDHWPPNAEQFTVRQNDV